jgi:hypothetical protein
LPKAAASGRYYRANMSLTDAASEERNEVTGISVHGPSRLVPRTPSRGAHAHSFTLARDLIIKTLRPGRLTAMSVLAELYPDSADRPFGHRASLGGLGRRRQARARRSSSRRRVSVLCSKAAHPLCPCASSQQ